MTNSNRLAEKVTSPRKWRFLIYLVIFSVVFVFLGPATSSALDFVLSEGTHSSNCEPQTFTVSNSTNQIKRYTVTTDPSQFSISLDYDHEMPRCDFGSVHAPCLHPGESVAVSVRVSTPGVTGEYAGTIHFGDETIPVNVTALPSNIPVTPSSLTLTFTEGYKPPDSDRTLIVSNTGNSPGWRTYGVWDDQSWMSVNHAEGFTRCHLRSRCLNTGQSGDIIVQFDGLTLGTQTGTVFVGSYSTTTEIPVTVTVEPTNVEVSPSSISLTVPAGQRPPDQTITVSNTGNSPAWRVYGVWDDQPWMSVYHAEGFTRCHLRSQCLNTGQSGDVTVKFNTFATPGTYTGKVFVSSGSTTVEIPVTITATSCQDNDGDGYQGGGAICPQGNDCDDTNPLINPGALEICDMADNNCNGIIDEGLSLDADEDGHYMAGSCLAPNDDCDDQNAARYPGNEELCTDDIDNDCDNEVNEGCCDISVSSFDCNPTRLNNASSQLLECSGVITSSDPNINWQVNIAEQVISGQGAAVSIDWSGRDVRDKLLEPESYPVNVTASNGPGCSDTASDSVIIEPRERMCPVPLGSSASLGSGNLYESIELFSTSGTGLTTNFVLSYNSLDPYNGPLGKGWTHSYDARITANSDGSFTLAEGDGKRTLLRQSGSFYTPSYSSYPALKLNGDGTSRLLYKDGTTYHFDALGKLIHIEDRNGNYVALAYDSTGNLTKITDPAGRETTLIYNATGRITSITAPGGGVFTLGYAYGSLVNMTNPDGTYWSFTYDSNAFMLSKIDPAGYTTTYTYDLEHRVASATDPEGGTKTVSYNPASGVTTVTERDGGLWTYVYDSSRGVLLEKTDPEGNTTSYAYDLFGNLLTRTDAEGNTTAYTYDGYGNVTSVTDPDGNTTSYTYNQFGQPTSITGSDGNVTTYAYDSRGNLTSITDPTGATTSYAYDQSGHIVSITDPSGATTTFNYDGAGNLASVTDPAGATTTFTYDGAGNLLTQTDAQSRTTRYAYDVRGRLLSVTDPLGGATAYTYDANGNMTSMTDANGNTTYYEYNHKGKLVRVIDAMGGVTEYSYGGGGCGSCGGGGENLASITDANGNTTAFAYDNLGRLISETDPLGNATNYAYDSRGNLSSRTDANGNTTLYFYDALGRLIEKEYPDGSLEKFEYDTRGNITYAGNLHMAYAFTYDAASRVASVTDSNGRTIRYEYDSSGRRIKMTTPPGDAVTYSYDQAGRLAELASGAGTFRFEYDSLGRRSALRYPHGAVATYAYDSAGRFVNLTHRASNGEVIDSFSYTLDPVGNRLTKQMPARTRTYQYDALYRLLEEVASTPGWSTEKNRGKGQGQENATYNQREYYTYDPVGNRLTSDPNRSYAYNAANQLLSMNGAGYSYDRNGNLVAKTEGLLVTTYEWDYENRLTRVSMPDGTIVVFKYDPFGRRIEKSINGQTTRYFYDSEDILFEYDGSGAVGNRYVHGPGIDEPLALINNKSVYYYHADGLGSIVAMTDTAERVVQTYEYNSFGHLKDQKNRIKQPFMFTGREWDWETGLYYYRARYYDPELGRFLQKDTIGFEGGINLYAYVDNNPIRWNDPLGLTYKGKGGDGIFYESRPCSKEDWAYCTEKCSPNKVKSCEAIYKCGPTYREGEPTISVKKINVICMCNVDIDDDCPEDEPLPYRPPWWWPFAVAGGAAGGSAYDGFGSPMRPMFAP